MTNNQFFQHHGWIFIYQFVGEYCYEKYINNHYVTLHHIPRKKIIIAQSHNREILCPFSQQIPEITNSNIIESFMEKLEKMY